MSEEQSVYSHKETDGSLSEVPLGKITFSGDSNEYVNIGNHRYAKDELRKAFGGSLNPGLSPASAYEFGNPAPVGLSAFAMTTFVLSLFNCGAMGIKTPNVVVSLAAFYGGGVQFLCGAWELMIGNTFGGTALTSYGAFWLAYSTIFLKAFNIAEAYTDEKMFSNAVGFFLLGWALFTFMLCLTTMKSTLAFFSLFAFLFITFILLAAGEFTGKHSVTVAGGVFGMITSVVAWYNAFAGVASDTNSYFTTKTIYLTKQE